MLRALITGISGFVGGHLTEVLTQQGIKVFGIDTRPSIHRVDAFFQGDIGNNKVLHSAVDEVKPNVIFHLSGLIKSDQPKELYNTNTLGTVTLFEDLMEVGQHPIVVVASSSAIYGTGFGRRPISERFKPRPLTHYAVSKLAQEITALHYFDAFQLPVIIIRMFNLLGPGQSPDLVCSAFARQIAIGEKNGNDEIFVGDINTRRDFIDVRDAARAILLIVKKGKAGQIYNVCSGRAIPIRRCLDLLLSMSPRHFKIRVNEERIQKNDVVFQVGSARKLKITTGWHPKIPLKQSLDDMLSDWRQKVAVGME